MGQSKFLLKILYNEILSYINSNKSIKRTFKGLMDKDSGIYHEINKFKAIEQNMHTFLDVFDNIEKRNSYYFSNVQNNEKYSKTDFMLNF